MAYYVNQYRQAFPTQFSVPTINTRGQAAIDAYNAGKADYENFAAHDAEMARAGYEASMKRLAAQDAWNAQQNAAVAHNQATNAGVIAIQQEIAQNEAEISKLKTELSQLTAQYGDADAMDRMLAANRARIGDMGNSLAHQQAINNRFQFQWSNKDKVKNQAKAVEKDIVDAYREIAFASDEQSRQVANYNLQTKLKEYKDLTGKDYTGNPFKDSPTGLPGSEAKSKTLETAYAKLQQSFDKNGHPSKAAVDRFLNEISGLPFSQALSDKVAEVKKLTTQESANEKNAKAVDRAKKAIANVKTKFSAEDLVGINAIKKFPAENGEEVTAKLLEYFPDGKKKVEFKVGKQREVVVY